MKSLLDNPAYRNSYGNFALVPVRPVRILRLRKNSTGSQPNMRTTNQIDYITTRKDILQSVYYFNNVYVSLFIFFAGNREHAPGVVFRRPRSHISKQIIFIVI